MAVKGKHGALLANRYRLLEQLGEGGMGSVWKAEHLALDTHVAIKLIDPDVARLELNLGRFLREAKTLASLHSPHVVQVLDFGSDAEMPYLVMELLHGQTLGRRLLEQRRLGLAEISQVMSEVCSAISLVHEQGLIHRDLKPDNIFLCDAGDRRVAKLVDFGIAKSFRGNITASMKTRTGHMLGTPSYMSPEQCRGLKDIDHRADLWALGVIVYECLLGRVPFEGEVLGDLLLRICMDPLPVPSKQPGGALPPGFDAWFARAVARDRTERFQSAAELAGALAELTNARGAPSLRSSPRHLAPSLGAPQASSPRHAVPSSPRHAVPSSPRHAVPLEAPSDAVTNTSMGLTSPARRVDRRVLRLALGAVGIAVVAVGAWAIGPNRAMEAESPSVEVQSLRPAYAVVPKVLRPRVATGRRLPSSPAPHAAAAAAAPTPAASPASVLAPPAPSSPPPGARPPADPTLVAPSVSEQAPLDAPPVLRGTAVPSTPPRAAGASLGGAAH